MAYAGDFSFNTFVAVDLGTTYSGYAFAIGQQSREYTLQRDNSGLASKIPTALLLRPDTSLYSFGESVLGDYAVLSEDTKEYYLFDRFKMKLQRDSMVSGDLPIKASNSDKTLPAKLVFSRVLEYFSKKAKKEITEGSLGKAAAWHDDETKWILTIPAIWGDRARAFMKEAAIEAGMVPKDFPEAIEIALEPEGAALCCRDDLVHAWRDLGHPENLRFIVVDCGGGTVDVTVNDLDVEGKGIAEVHRATGDAWGGTYVDEEIKKFIRRVIGEEVSTKIPNEKWLQFTRNGIEVAKRGITVETATEMVIFALTTDMLQAISDAGGDLEEAVKAFPGVTYRKRLAHLLVDVKLIGDCFKGCLKKISDHLHGLMDSVSGVQCMLVVGGFSDSPFLINHMEKEFKSKCRVIRPQQASLAVVKGAVMYGQNPDVIKTRISKYTYGVRSATPFISDKHPESKKLIGSEGPMCDHIFDAFLKADEVVSIGNAIEKIYRPFYADQTEVTFEIFRTEKTGVIFTDDPGCEKLVSVTIDSPNTEKGVNRELRAQMDFSRTQLYFMAYDVSSDQKANVEVKFHMK